MLAAFSASSCAARGADDASSLAPATAPGAGADAVAGTAARDAADTTVPPSPSPSPTSSLQSAGAGTNGASGLLSLADARLYMVTLINRDRESAGLRPVTLDPGPPTAAAQAHADDMAKNGYLGHWGTDGSVPEARLTAAGGSDMTLENALCFTDEHPRTLDGFARFDVRELDKAEAMFFHEVPPNDGHRKNILRPWHTQVGIGIAQPVATPTENPVPCLVQELTDEYGAYGPLPTAANPGATVHVEGQLHAPATFAGIGLARTDAPAPIGVHILNGRRSYPVPAPHITYWTHGFRTPKEVQVTNGHFSIDIPLLDAAGQPQPGLYEVSIWARLPETRDLQIVSLRTIDVEPLAKDSKNGK